jgi:flagellar biosynthesis protein FlhB
MNLALLLVGILSAAVFYRDMVANPIDAGRALVRFYQLPAQRRQSSVLQTVSAEWWRVMLVPVYVLAALMLVGILGGGQ